MNAERFQRVMDLFQGAVALTAGDRSAFLDRSCSGDIELRRAVEAMLREDGRDGHIDPVGGGQQLLAAALVRTHAGPEPRVHGLPSTAPVLSGQYRILRMIGEGGMGTVYEAEQSRPRRRIALKVIRSGLVSRHMLQRFEHEAHVLGRLHHPGIAQIYEAGVADESRPDQAFIAMELVRGSPLTVYAQERRLDLRQRLELLARVCDAVQHAHQRGVIHRDLKPSNILVEEGLKGSRDEAIKAGAVNVPTAIPRSADASISQPKILDFGVARVMDAEDPLTAMQTSAGQLIGTLAYMSPEQVSADPDAIDTRCDVYALGVILYQLVTGSLPHDLTNWSFPDAARVIRDDPPIPPGDRSRAARGDVETIVLKAIAKDKNRRYQSAEALASDIRRHLGGRPIDARRDSMLYVMRKQVLRHKGPAAVGLLFVVMSIGFGIYATIQADAKIRLARAESLAKQEALAARDKARDESARADATAQRLAKELVASNIERGRLLGAVGATPVGEGILWREYLRDPSSDHAHWALWELYARNPCLRSIQVPKSHLSCVAFSLNNRRIATGTSDGQVLVWDGDLADAPRVLKGHTDGLTCLTFSADDTRLVSGSLDKTLRLWDASSGELLHVLSGHSASVTDARFTADGALLFSSDEHGDLFVWDPVTGRRRGQLEAHTGGLGALALSPDGRTLASGGADKTIKLWDIGSDAMPRLRSELVGHTGGVVCIAFNAEGTRLGSGGLEGVARVWNPANGQSLMSMKIENQAPTSLFFGPDGHRLFVGGEHVLVMDLDTGRRIEILKERPGGLMRIALRPDGALFATGAMDGTLRLWETATDRCQTWMQADTGWALALAFRPDGRTLASGGINGGVKFWDGTDGRPQTDVTLEGAKAHAIAWSHRGGRLATGGTDGSVRIWNPSDGTCIKQFKGHLHGVNDLAFSPDDRMLASCGSDKCVRLWDVATGDEVFRLPDRPGPMAGLAFSSDGKRLATVGQDQAGTLIDLERREVIAELPGSHSMWSVAFSPDGTMLAAGTWTGTLEVCDAFTQRSLGSFTGHTGVVTSLSFSPNGRLIATACTDGTVRLWSAEPKTLGQPLATLEAHEGQVSKVAFSPDGRRLATGCQTGRLGLWDLAYYDRHVLGNLDYQLARLSAETSGAGTEEYNTAARRIREALTIRNTSIKPVAEQEPTQVVHPPR